MTVIQSVSIEEFSEPEVEDLEQVEESLVDVLETQEVASWVSESIIAKLREEIDRLEKGDQLTTKDDEKREVIRQLNISMDILKENVVLSKKNNFKESSKEKGSFEFNKLKGLFSGMMQEPTKEVYKLCEAASENGYGGHFGDQDYHNSQL
ncbi:hypothetical protein GIB67_035856 [Kingdonia uniflora]|uniref:Uncharacterized protein n=1 Tax=Kingdonia uniflora TaxID=39325 RepID=A0A7J7MJM8_9MAGN|nr:hypothetical protein GIB67_035856 [Kingdonia uniflora]